MSYCSL